MGSWDLQRASIPPQITTGITAFNSYSLQLALYFKETLEIGLYPGSSQGRLIRRPNHVSQVMSTLLCDSENFRQRYVLSWFPESRFIFTGSKQLICNCFNISILMTRTHFKQLLENMGKVPDKILLSCWFSPHHLELWIFIIICIVKDFLVVLLPVFG